MGFFILGLQYAVDRFSLFRIWGWNPLLGSELANFSRKYMVTGALLTFAIISSYTFSQFPYDNVCDPPEGSSELIPGDGTFSNVAYNDGELVPSPNGPGLITVKQTTQSAYWYVVHSFVSRLLHNNLLTYRLPRYPPSCSDQLWR
jgi:hypothetical protein